MIASPRPSVLSRVALAPRDPILGLTETFNADKNPSKVNLGVGIYCDESGRVPLLDCVRRAEKQLADNAPPRAYLPIDGIPAYDKAAQHLIFGSGSDRQEGGRIITVQALGGTGGLKIGADFLRRAAPDAQIWISDPSWENHRALFENAGFKVNSYPYYDPATHGLDFSAMLNTFETLPEGSIVVLHACCHNPTGVDLTLDQWERVIGVVTTRGLVPFLDLAYQGFADGIDEDAEAVRRFARAGGPVFVSNSFSKSFSLYGERVGALSVVTSGDDEAARVLSQLKRIIRTNYSNPPTHGGQVVAAVLNSPELRGIWARELAGMRERIRQMRLQLVEKLRQYAAQTDFSFIASQRGMFSYSGLSREAVLTLREKFGVYAVDTGRICVAALNTANLDYVARSIGAVIRH